MNYSLVSVEIDPITEHRQGLADAPGQEQGSKLLSTTAEVERLDDQRQTLYSV